MSYYRSHNGFNTTELAQQAAQDQINAELAHLRAENSRLAEREREIMRLLGGNKPERILHDLRNLLNERALLKALCDAQEEDGK